MSEYVALDVSQKETSICVMDAELKILAEGKVATDPAKIVRYVRRHAPSVARIGLESGALSEWLCDKLREEQLPVVCLDARIAHAALSGQLNKTDRNDARGLARLVRMGWYREVRIKSTLARHIRGLLASRGMLIATRVNLENQVRGLLKSAGLLVGRIGRQGFSQRIRSLTATVPVLAAVVRPLLVVHATLNRQLKALDKQLRAIARQDAEVRRAMTAPGVGLITALAFRACIDDPGRFRHARSVGPYLGLTSRRYQSGQIDRTGRISKAGDRWLRTYLYEAAHVLMTRIRRPSALRTWALRLAGRIGAKKAKVALARKLAVVLHSMWRHRTTFDWAL